MSASWVLEGGTDLFNKEIAVERAANSFWCSRWPVPRFKRCRHDARM
jgi:hypothetical protein